MFIYSLLLSIINLLEYGISRYYCIIYCQFIRIYFIYILFLELILLFIIFKTTMMK